MLVGKILPERGAVSDLSVSKKWKNRLARWVPFGLGQVKPKHFRDMARVFWENRDNLPYAWKVLTRGVCDGCALGVAGLHASALFDSKEKLVVLKGGCRPSQRPG